MNSQDRTSLAMKTTTAEGSWAQMCAVVGAVIWAGVAVLARIGVAPIGAIELMFLFAPLVIVPLGMELGRVMGSDTPLTRFARRIQPLAAALAVVALRLPPGRVAGGLVCLWMVVCLSMTIAAIIDLSSLVKSRPESSTHSTIHRITLAVAQLDLSVGGAWLVASRLGLRPMGIQEPIGLLTAVHFHYAGFATAMIAAAMLQFAAQRQEYRWLRWLVAVVIGMPFIVALGFVISPQLKLGAAAVFSASVAGLAVVLRSCAKRLESGTARVLFHVASVTVFAGMVLSTAYAVADFRGSDVLPIPQMARTHGILNAVGFCLSGLLGWLVENGGGVSQ
jgi:YndJ-like protein